MPTYRISGVKEGSNGPIEISETAPSLTRAEWVAAHYREHGYKVTINEEQKNATE